MSKAKDTNPTFQDLVRKIADQRGKPLFMGKVLAIDPGETTGIATFNALELIKFWQEDTKTLESSAKNLTPILVNTAWDAVVIEEYRVFSWRSKEHSWSHLHTPQLIGYIRGTLAIEGIKPIMQTPQNAKGFCTDQKLKDWGFYQRGMPHARDAIRHGSFFLLFGKKGK